MIVTLVPVGDCRAVVQHADGSLQVMSGDHRSSGRAERARMLAAGGFVRQGRAYGVLEPSRTVGDVDLKQDGKAVVIAEPGLRSAELTLKGAHPCVLLMGTDGVWDALKNDAAMAVAVAAMGRKGKGNPATAARAVVEAAAAAGSQDDITAIVVRIRPPE